MNRSFSTFLDLSRFLAALLVFFYHAEYLLKDNRLSPVASFGHDAVIFFFILSGFVIGYVSSCKEKCISDFFVARAARLYSVAIPSLLIAYLLVQIGNTYFASTYSADAGADWLSIFIGSMLFANESWPWGITVPTNAPYWSICYEAWYYIIFGIFFYLRGKIKYLLLVAAAGLAGPKILLLMPIWVSGVLCYRVHGGLQKSRFFGYLAIFLATTVYILIRVNNVDDAIFQYSAQFLGGEVNINATLGFSKRFVSDYLIAIIFIIILYGFYMISNDIKKIMSTFEAPIKFAAAHTFSLYLFHYPLLILMSQLNYNTAISLAASLAVIFIISTVTESQRSCLVTYFNKLIKQ